MNKAWHHVMTFFGIHREGVGTSYVDENDQWVDVLWCTDCDYELELPPRKYIPNV